MLAYSPKSWLKGSSIQAVGLTCSKYSVSKHKTNQDNSMQKQELHRNSEVSSILIFLLSPVLPVERHLGQNKEIKQEDLKRG